MKTRNFIVLLFLAVFFFFSSTGVMGQNYISAKGGIGKRETAPSGPMYTGNGGSNIRLAVLAPEVQGAIPDYLPIYIQGLLNNNIKKFSAINLIDRQNLNRIIAEQNLAAGGRYSDKDFVSIGNLTNAQYFLFGTIQKLSGNRYSLQLSVTESSKGEIKASFMKDGTSAQFEESGTILNEAAAELLGQLGVQLTAAGKQTLLAGSTAAVQAEAGLAKGITAQATGAEARALFNFAQAITFDPSQMEALSRLNTLSAGISGGTISQKIVNDIQARDQWIEVFKETTIFYNDHPPFEVIFDPSLIQIGETNYTARTANLGMRIALDPSEAGFKALNTLLEGLEKTGKSGTWGFSDWPLWDIKPKTAGTVLFGGKQAFSCKVDISLLNEKNKTISKSSITLTTGISSSGKTITKPGSIEGTVNFPNVKAADLTDVLTIVIDSVNGIQAGKLSASGYMKVETGDLEKRIREREAAANVHYDQGIKNYDANKYDQAIANFTEAIKINPNYIDAYYFRGLLYDNLKEYKKAIADYTQVISIDPNYANVYINRGLTYDNLKEYNKAITDYTQAIRINPNDERTYNIRGLAYRNLRDYKKAIADYTQAISINPNYADAYFNRGYDYSDLKEYKKAIADYTQVIRINPNNTSAYNNRGFAYKNMRTYTYYNNFNNFNKAIEDYKQALNIDPNNSTAFKNLGNIYGYISAYFNRGLSYSKKGYYDQAISDYTEVIKLDSKYSAAYNNRGVAYEKIGDKKRAIADYETAVKLEPKNTLYSNNLKELRGW